MKKLAIIGAGDLGQLVTHHAPACGFEVAGFFDDFKTKGSQVNSYPILGAISEVLSNYNDKVFDVLFVAIGYNHFEFRRQIFEELSAKIEMATLIHPSCFVDESCIVGRGVFLLPGSSLDRNVTISENVLINIGCTIAHDSMVGAHSFLSPSVSLAGFVRIGECCNLGIGTIVIDGLKINSYVQTGGGTVIINSISERGLYVGNPSRFIR
jgi:sugar O-acyltransferase (sialic acid O-acetyltransferase NeuD family)